MGNTNVALGVVKGERLCFTARMATDRQKTEDEYALSFSSILSLRGVSTDQITGAIVSSVVPELKEILRRAIELALDKELTIKTIFRYRHIYPMAIDAVAAGKVNLKGLATHIFDFDDLQNAMDQSVADKANIVKAVVKMTKD